MKTAISRSIQIFLFIGVASLLFVGCDAFSSSDDEKGIVTLTGQVLNARTNNPVEGAFIQVLPYDLLFEADAEGRFEFTVEIDSTMELELTASRDGFTDGHVSVLAIAGRTIDVPVLSISPTAVESAESGLAANILLSAQSSGSIGVRESGSEEVATIEFLVADSIGRPVVLDKSALVSFKFGVSPGGGETLSPTEATTDNNGIAVVYLSSGTRAGVVQIIAEIQVDGRTVRSLPVAVSIHGGLPDQEHFSIGPEQFNFPGLLAYGLSNGISVIVGDKYSNPVRTGTAVYFSSTHGVISGSILTDQQGGGTVDLLSANPLPDDGIALVTARTADDAQLTVLDSTPIVFSGSPVLTISPGFAALNQEYNLRITDHNGNPLSLGTTVSVLVEGTSVKGVGNTSIELNDTAFSGGVLYEHVVRGPGVTDFKFWAVEIASTDTTVVPVVEAITIRTSGPNGRLEVVLGAGGVPSTPTRGARIEKTLDGSLIARAKEVDW